MLGFQCDENLCSIFCTVIVQGKGFLIPFSCSKKLQGEALVYFYLLHVASVDPVTITSIFFFGKRYNNTINC